MNAKIKLLELAKRMGRYKLSAISDMGTYLFKMSYDKLIEYELSLPSSFGISLAGLCIYHQRDLNRLSKKQRQELAKIIL